VGSVTGALGELARTLGLGSGAGTLRCESRRFEPASAAGRLRRRAVSQQERRCNTVVATESGPGLEAFPAVRSSS